jgi:hypothetical protein
MPRASSNAWPMIEPSSEKKMTVKLAYTSDVSVDPK